MCQGTGVYKAVVAVSRVLPDKKSEIVWFLESASGGNVEISRLTWGVAPAGWSQKSPTKDLENGGTYSIEGAYFRYTMINGRPQIRLLERNPFGKINDQEA